MEDAEPMTETRYWRGRCDDPVLVERMGSGINVSFTTAGEHKEGTEDKTEFPFDCPVCKKEHVALRISKEEHDRLAAEDDENDSEIPDFIVDGLGDWAGPPEELITVDVMKVTPLDPDDFTTVGSLCSWCGEDIELGQEVMLWGEPHGKFVAIKTFDKDECLREVLDDYVEKKGAKALMIRYKS